MRGPFDKLVHFLQSILYCEPDRDRRKMQLMCDSLLARDGVASSPFAKPYSCQVTAGSINYACPVPLVTGASE